eukprot:TRINITY_DN7546_c0_g1_i1.p1 TRINITY_DN7546_c0_g1~~TRINITY_DN7546_c0_g1_i1.p1  ORF type:complete len:193 (-),score=34.07 TRINITY_DN7546_c0_g1_i1:158-736(-)
MKTMNTLLLFQLLGVIPALSGTGGLVTGGVPGLTIDLSKVLHGEQYIKILKPLPAEAKLTNTFKIQDILDKGKGMVLLVEVESRDETGDVVLLNQLSIFVVGGGGFGGARTSEHIIDVSTIPSRMADASAEYQTSVDQAALYRMTGDLNPLHISPDFAAMEDLKPQSFMAFVPSVLQSDKSWRNLQTMILPV